MAPAGAGERLEALDARAGGDFAGLDDEAATCMLEEIADAEFFVFIRGVAVVTLYDDLDCLPDPRIEEYDGPDALVEVAPADEPAGAVR